MARGVAAAHDVAGLGEITEDVEVLEAVKLGQQLAAALLIAESVACARSALLLAEAAVWASCSGSSCSCLSRFGTSQVYRTPRAQYGRQRHTDRGISRIAVLRAAVMAVRSDTIVQEHNRPRGDGNEQTAKWDEHRHGRSADRAGGIYPA